VPYILEREADWPEFVCRAVPQLRARGWEVNVPVDFPPPRAGYFVLGPSFRGSQRVVQPDMGIGVEGRKLALAHCCMNCFVAMRAGSILRANAIPDSEPVILPLPKPTGTSCGWPSEVVGAHPGRLVRCSAGWSVAVNPFRRSAFDALVAGALGGSRAWKRCAAWRGSSNSWPASLPLRRRWTGASVAAVSAGGPGLAAGTAQVRARGDTCGRHGLGKDRSGACPSVAGEGIRPPR